MRTPPTGLLIRWDLGSGAACHAACHQIVLRLSPLFALTSVLGQHQLMDCETGLAERFTSRVHRGIRRTRGSTVWYCDEWSGAKSSTGRARMRARGRLMAAAHVAWFLHYGWWPPIRYGKLQMNHRCDNQACVNVDHLYLGTPKQNGQDRRYSQPLVAEPEPSDPSERRVAWKLAFFRAYGRLPDWWFEEPDQACYSFPQCRNPSIPNC